MTDLLVSSPRENERRSGKTSVSSFPSDIIILFFLSLSLVGLFVLGISSTARETNRFSSPHALRSAFLKGICLCAMLLLKSKARTELLGEKNELENARWLSCSTPS